MSKEPTQSPLSEEGLPWKGILAGLGVILIFVGILALTYRSAGPVTASLRLSENELAKVVETHGQNAQRLANYGWVNESAGVAHVPIERAMEMVVVNGGHVPKPVDPEASP